MDFSFSSYGKNLKPCSIRLRVLEKHKLRIALTAAETVRYNSLNYNSYKEHSIFDCVYDENEYLAVESDLLDTEWSISKPVHLPQDLQSCTHSVNSSIIKIHHTLAFEVDLKDDFGKNTQVSPLQYFYGGLKASNDKIQISGAIPFSIYMSPYSVMDNGIVYRQNFDELKHESLEPPPSYGDHSSDLNLSTHVTLC